MAMSRDRVRFTLAPHNQETSVQRAFLRAFGQHMPRSTGMEITVICRPSQFARFLIYRNDEGGRNGFKDLCPELFVPEPPKMVPMVLDVSEEPASGR